MGTTATASLIAFMTGKSETLRHLPTEETAIAAFHEQADNVEKAKAGRDRIALYILAGRLAEDQKTGKTKILNRLADELDLSAKYKSYLKGGMFYFVNTFQPQSEETAMAEAVRFIRDMPPLRSFDSKGNLKAEDATTTTAKGERRTTPKATAIGTTSEGETEEATETTFATSPQDHLLAIHWHIQRLREQAEAGDAFAIEAVKAFETIEIPQAEAA